MDICGICFEAKEGKEIEKICNNNNHIFCNSCISTYFKGLIKEGTIEKITCPFPNCSQLDPIRWRNIFQSDSNLNSKLDGDNHHGDNDSDEKILDRFDRLQLERTLELMSDIVYCPKIDCGFPVWASLKKRQGKCGKCSHCFCIRCKSDSHFGPCSPIINIDKEVTNWLENNTKQCPRCFIYIEKNGGCSHMYCTRCKLHFDWNQTSYRQISPLQNISKMKNLEKQWTSIRFKPTQESKHKGKKCPNCRCQVNDETKIISNHISCENCQTKFCYSCLSPVKKSSSHFNLNSKCKLSPNSSKTISVSISVNHFSSSSSNTIQNCIEQIEQQEEDWYFHQDLDQDYHFIPSCSSIHFSPQKLNPHKLKAKLRL